MSQSKPQPPAGPAPVTRALTVKDPWAWLLVSDFIQPGIAVKPVENRTWPTNFRGPVAIHTSSDQGEIFDLELGQWLYSLHQAIADQFELPMLPGDDPKKPKISSIYHPGAIVGVVEIFDCLPFDIEAGDDFESICRNAGHGAWYDSHAIPPAEFASGPYCFLTRNPRQFTQPPACAGALNFWYLDKKPGMLAAVAAALKKPLGSPYHYRAKIAAASAAAGAAKPAQPRRPAVAK